MADDPQTLELRISEVFGPTVQGEGPNLGARCGFVRLYGCNLSCYACDSTYAWKDGERAIVPVSTILEWLGAMGAPVPLGLVVITGGEPLLQQHKPGMKVLIRSLVDHGARVQVETNGTRVPELWLQEYSSFSSGSVTFVVSPKVRGALASDPQNRRIYTAALEHFVNSPISTFKFVVGGADDLNAVATFVDRWQIEPGKVWIMAEGTSPDVITKTSQAIVDTVLSCGFNLTTRFHLHLWPNDTKGR